MTRLILILATFLAVTSGFLHFSSRLRKSANKFDTESRLDVQIDTGFVNQFIDHTSTNSDVFSQKYLYTTAYRTNSKIAFLVISETGDIEADILANPQNPIVQAARVFGATVFALEHRYYGDSRPFNSTADSNLIYLSSDQALADIYMFLNFAKKQYNLDPSVKWILFGAGYGGVLAAESRKLHPDVVTGAIASSAPLRRKYDFWEFNQNVAIAIDKIDKLNPFLKCHQNIRQAFLNIASLILTPEGRNQLSDDLKLRPRFDNTTLSDNLLQNFYFQLITAFQVSVQLHNEFGINIQGMCQIMANTTQTPTQNIFGVYQYAFGGIDWIPISYSDVVQTYSYTDVNSPFVEDRLVFWQECSEFGWYGNTNTDEQAMFGAGLPQSYFVNLCADVFKGFSLTAGKIFNAIEGSNKLSGGNKDYSGTNVVFTSGEYDPLNSLNKMTSQDSSVVTYTIPGMAYASDVFPGNRNNTGIQRAHQLVIENIRMWFNSPPNPNTYVNTTVPWTRPGTLNIKENKEEMSRFSKLGDDVPSKKTYPAGGYKRVLMGRPPHGLKPLPDMNERDSYPAGFEQGVFRQRVDHFDNTNPSFFNQKYFKNSQWAKPGGPNFLMIGGEGPESPRWVLNENITYLTWAQKYGATVYLLEHRFYGDSLVGDNTEFKYLSSLQMLYDLADFIRSVNAQSTTPAPWITFGGSYSGAMSAWMREVFPDLVIAAVGSSGPVFAKTDFFEYLVVVEQSIRTYSNDCAEAIRSGFATMHQLFLTKDGRKNLSDIFQLVPAFGDKVTETDKHYFFSTIYGNFQGAVQYSGDNSGPYAYGYGIPDACKIMLDNSTTPIQRIAAFNRYMTVFYQGGGNFTGTDNAYEDMVDSIRNAQEYGPDSAAGLLWTWQTCTEFGYFQSADAGNLIFGSPAPVNMYIQLCKDVFGSSYDRTYIDSVVDYTNYKYGSRDQYRGTNVVLPNGNVDPWHALGSYSTANPSVIPYLINGTAHCADMYPARAADVPGLKIVRDLIDSNLAKWLSQAPVTAAPVTVTSTVSTSNITTTSIPTTTTGGSSSILSVSSMILISVFSFYL